MASVNEAVAAYVRLRDAKQALAKQHAEEMRGFTDKLEKIEAWLLAVLNNQGVESARTDSGTAYKSTQTRAKIEDWDTAFEFIKTNELFHMLERRVSKTAIEEFVEAQGAPPPGISITQEVRINVRR